MRALLRVVAVVSLLAAAARSQQVVVVVLDDVGIDRVACYGTHADAGPTPTLDALAAGGVLFRSCYANASCSPSRMAMLTGRYGSRTGVGAAYGWTPGTPVYEPTSGEFLPELVPAPTALVGKYHLSQSDWLAPVSVVGFDTHRGSIANLNAFVGGGYTHWKKNVATAATGAVQYDETTYATTDTVDDAIAFVERRGPAPYLLWLAFNAAHAPFHVPPAGLHSFPGLIVGSPASLKHRAMLEAADHELGRLLARLRPSVTVLVIGDNGTPAEAATAPLSPGYKATVYEGGIRVPLIVAGPLVRRPGRQVSHLVQAVDVFATVLDLFGRPHGTGADSVSLLPYLIDPAAPPQRFFAYSEHFEPNGFGPYTQDDRMATDGRFKLIVRLSGEPELYDLSVDPLEQADLWPPSTPRATAAASALQAVIDSCSAP